MSTSALPSPTPLVLPATTPRAVLFQVGLVGATVALPAVAHAAGLPVRQLLPMHWPVLLAGLVYGWRAGFAVGALAPVVNFLLTGFPLPAVLPAMTVELALYGGVTGLLREGQGWNRWLAVAAGLVAGRLAFAAVALLGFAHGNDLAYLAAALTPGIPAAVAQLLLLPVVATLWVRWEGRR